MWKFMTRRFEKQTLLSIEAAKKFKGVGSLDTIGRIQLPSIPSTAKLNSIIELQSQSIVDTLHNKHHSSRQNLRTPKLSPLPLPEDGKKRRRKRRRRRHHHHKNEASANNGNDSVSVACSSSTIHSYDSASVVSGGPSEHKSQGSRLSSKHPSRRSTKSMGKKASHVPPNQSMKHEANHQSRPQCYEDMVHMSKSYELPRAKTYPHHDKSPIKSVFELNNYKTYPIMEREFMDERHLATLR